MANVEVSGAVLPAAPAVVSGNVVEEPAVESGNVVAVFPAPTVVSGSAAVVTGGVVCGTVVRVVVVVAGGCVATFFNTNLRSSIQYFSFVFEVLFNINTLTLMLLFGSIEDISTRTFETKK